MSIEWRPIVGLENFYEASTAGEIRPFPRPIRFIDKKGVERFRFLKIKTMATVLDSRGYPCLTLPKSCDLIYSKRKTVRVHRLIALTFLGSPPSLQCDVNHKNYDRTDNRVSNLEWVTRSENQVHMWKQKKMESIRMRLSEKCTTQNKERGRLYK